MELRDEIADEIAAALLAKINRPPNAGMVTHLTDAIMPLVRRAQAEAWDAGFDEASDDIGRAQMMRDLGESGNPYIEQETGA